MPRKLPARPNLEHLRTQAKSLLSRYRAGDREAVKTFLDHLPEAAKLTARQAREREFRLADAQAAIARKSGFSQWPALARHVDQLRHMEGKWAFRSLELDGQKMPAAMLGASFLLIDGDRFRTESPEAVYDGVFLIDVESIPHRIDIDFVEGPEAGNRSEGLFELDGDHFRICLGLTGARRPTAFATSPGSGHALEDLVRVEHARPAGVEGGTPPPAKAPVQHEAEPFDTEMTPVIEKLQGEWSPVELITSGVPLNPAYLSFGRRVQEGVEARVIFNGQTMLHVRMRMNEGVTPVEVDYLHLAGAHMGALSKGLFRWDGEMALFCIGAPGVERPSDFSCAAGSGRTLSRWKRRA